MKACDYVSNSTGADTFLTRKKAPTQNTSNETKLERQMKCQLRQEGTRPPFKATTSHAYHFFTTVCCHTEVLASRGGRMKAPGGFKRS